MSDVVEHSDDAKIGVVAIGRNEGDRLKACLASVVSDGRTVVYVDSGSSDGSVSYAKSIGVEVVELSTREPFTAARARNAGFERLIARQPAVEFVQFVDGDCVIDAKWIDAATGTMRAMPKAAVVCGRRRERFPDASTYNALCDIEWNTPIGQASECGGDALMRVEAFTAAGGYNGDLIAGEEPELCVRLRSADWTIQRIDAEMTLHDAAMTRFGQWWNRNVRAGHAFAEGASMHGASPMRHWVRQTQSNWIWGFAVPFLAIVGAIPTFGLSLLLLVIVYALQMTKVFLNARHRGINARPAKLFAVFCVLGKMPQALGQMKFTFGRLSGRRSALIEYKPTPAASIN